jgi:hypothetical protein
MELTEFRIQMFKCVLDSDWVKVSPLTVLVGKNEAGKTTLLKALHKFNPFVPEPYNMAREWPRGHRDSRTDEQIVCTARFELTQEEIDELKKLTDVDIDFKTLDITRDYGGRFEVLFPDTISPTKLHPTDIDAKLQQLPDLPEEVGDDFREQAIACQEEASRLAQEGKLTDLAGLHSQHKALLEQAYTEGNPEPQHAHELQFTSQFISTLQGVATQLRLTPTIHQKAHEYIVKRIPTFVYMDEYRSFRGTAMLDQVKDLRDKKRLAEDDKTLLTILALAELDLDELVKMGTESDREERQYDLDDGAVTLSNKIRNAWGQLEYDVKFGADGQQFFTWVKGTNDRALIRLEERSRGFQWFFSFDLLLMHQTKGTLKGCVILLDEPGLHLHPDGQRDLLKRLRAYAEANRLVYTSHLPFMIDLQEPDSIRILSETEDGTVVTDDLTKSQPEGKLTLQAALGMSGRTSFLVAEKNLVVEGVDDYWILTELSNLFVRLGKEGLSEDIHITAAGGASEVTYIATFMIGQELNVVALYDTDQAGNDAKDKLVKKWLARYKDRHATALSLAGACDESSNDFSIEDLFPEAFYCKYVNDFYAAQIAATGKEFNIRQGGQVAKRIEEYFEQHGLKFNKGSIAKRLCADIRKMKDLDELPKETVERATKAILAINKPFKTDTVNKKVERATVGM